MKRTMNAAEAEIKGMDLFGARLKYVEDPETRERFFYGNDISRAMKGLCLRTKGLSQGKRKFFKGYTSSGKYIKACQFLNIDAIDEVMAEVQDLRKMNTPFYINWNEDVERANMGLFKFDSPQTEMADCQCNRSDTKGLEARIVELEKQLKEYKLTKAIDSIELGSDRDFQKKWGVSMSIINQYVDNRVAVLDTMDAVGKAAYRSHLWNDFILVEVDSKLHTALRKEHKATGKKYKQLIYEKGLIDGFFAVVSNLLKFGKG